MDACSTDNLTVYINSTLLDAINNYRALKLSPVIAYLAILMILGVFGNSLVIYVYSTRFKRTSTTYFVLWLAVLDLLSCITSLPFEISDIVYNANFKATVICKISRFLATVFIMASALCLLVVAFDRYFKVCKPHKRPPFSSLKQIVVLTVVITALCSWPTLLTFGIEDVKVTVTSGEYAIAGSECSSDMNISKTIIRAYWVILGFIFIVSSIFMVTVYSLLAYSLYKNEATMAATRTPETNPETYKSSSRSPIQLGRTTRLFVAITAVFILSFFPMLALIVVETLSKFCDLSVAGDVFVKIFIRSQYINNVANPFLYGFYNPIFRRECKYIFFRRFLVFFHCSRYNLDDDANCAEDQSSNALDSSHEHTAHYKIRLNKTASDM